MTPTVAKAPTQPAALVASPAPPGNTITRVVRHVLCGLLTLGTLFLGVSAMYLSVPTLVALAVAGCVLALLDPRRPLWTLIGLCCAVAVRAFAVTVFGAIAWIFGPVAFSFETALWSCVAMAVGCGVGLLIARVLRRRERPR